MNTALRLAVAAFLAGTIAACGSDDTGDDVDADIIEVVYDGTECTSNAPASVSAGEQTFVLINNSDPVTQLLVADIEQGHTYQELIDLQNEAGGDRHRSRATGVACINTVDRSGVQDLGHRDAVRVRPANRGHLTVYRPETASSSDQCTVRAA